MIEFFLLICSILAIAYLVNVVIVLFNICSKKKSGKSIVRINPYKFYKRIFWNMNDGYGTDRKVGIVPIICTILMLIGFWSIIMNVINLIR